MNSWLLKITLMSVVLGMLIAVSLKTQQHVRSQTGVATMRWGSLAAAYTGTKRENAKLRDQIEEQEIGISRLQKALGEKSSAAGVLSEDLQISKFLAGLTDAVGPGIVVTLKDSAKMPAGEPDRNLWIIHDSDIQQVVNELRSAGAEAISVSDQRLIATSPIRCVGPVVLVNGVELASPYKINAIGDPKTMEGALRMPGGVVDQVPDPEMITIEQKEKVVAKAFDGSRQFRYATPVNR